MITIKTDFRQVEKMLAGIKNGVARAARDSINDTVKHVKAQASRDIRDKWAVRKRDLDPHLKIMSRATLTRLQSELAAEGLALPLRLFNPKVIRGEGVRVTVHKGKVTLVSGAFEATMKSGHVGIFRRPFKSRRDPNAKAFKTLPERIVKSGAWRGTVYRPALPIREMFTVEVPTMWLPYIQRHAEQAAPYLQQRLLQRIERLLDTGK